MRPSSTGPADTRPEATAPATAPRKNGVTNEEAAKAAPNVRCSRTFSTGFRKANPAPRRMIPTPAAVSGTYSVDAIAAKAAGNPVHKITRTKISQT